MRLKVYYMKLVYNKNAKDPTYYASREFATERRLPPATSKTLASIPNC